MTPTLPSPSRSPGRPSLRIAFLDSWKRATAEGTGTAVAIVNLARGLRALGHEVVVPGGPTPGVETGSHRNGSVPGVRQGGETSLLLRRIRFNARLPRRIRREGPFDLVVGFDIDGVFWSGTPSHPRSRYVLALKGIAADEARFATGRDRSLLRLQARLEGRNARGAHRVVVTSGYSGEVAIRAYDLLPERVRIVPESIDLAPWAALAASPPPRAGVPTLLTVARQYPRKDTATLLRALPLVRRRIPPIRLRVLGGGPELPRLRALTEELHLGESVDFDGPIPGDEAVRRAYFQAHLFCLPSLQEGFGIVFLEAMAAGLPIVAARAGAVPEVVPHGEVGLLVPPRDPEALAGALLRVLEDPLLARTLGEAGRHRVESYQRVPVARTFLDAAGVFSSGEEAADRSGSPDPDARPEARTPPRHRAVS